jgi:uncharacterized protein YbcV (DUF1398 family)
MGKLINTATIHECTLLSFEQRGAFPEVVKRLRASGIERYRADLIRREKTYYDAHGNSHIESQPLEIYPVTEKFSGGDIKAALRSVQMSEIGYREFVTKIMAAGVASYTVFLSGRRAVYIGRHGDFHVELFPGAK